MRDAKERTNQPVDWNMCMHDSSCYKDLAKRIAACHALQTDAIMSMVCWCRIGWRRTDAAILQHVHHGLLVLEGGAFSPQAQARHEAQVLGLGGTSGTDIQDPCLW